ncbi:MAG TPA: glycosyltransferase family 4 protein [Actinomycetota bacterium]
MPADALLVTSSFLPGRGGIESYLAELCAELAPRIAVLAPASRDAAEIPAALGYAVDGVERTMLWPGRRVVDATIAGAARHSTERVLFGTPWPLVLTGPRLARAGLRYSAIVHGAELTVPAAVPGLRHALARSLRGADALFAVSDYTVRSIRGLIGPGGPSIDLLRARVDLERFRPDADAAAARSAYGIPPDAKVVLCFGRLVARKGVDRLIEALPAITARVPEAVLVVAGTGPELKSLRRLAARRRAPVLFTGRVDDAYAPGLYATASVFSLPVADRWFGLEVEGLGVVLLEAAACGVPCVTGRSGGTPEALVDGETGFVIDARDDAALVDRIAWLLEHPDDAARLGARGREHVAKEFTNRPLPPALLQWLG